MQRHPSTLNPIYATWGCDNIIRDPQRMAPSSHTIAKSTHDSHMQRIIVKGKAGCRDVAVAGYQESVEVATRQSAAKKNKNNGRGQLAHTPSHALLRGL